MFSIDIRKMSHTFILQPLFLNAVSIGPSVKKEEDNIGFSIKNGENTLGLDCLSINDKTLWISKLSEALNNFVAIEKQFLSKCLCLVQSDTE